MASEAMERQSAKQRVRKDSINPELACRITVFLLK